MRALRITRRLVLLLILAAAGLLLYAWARDNPQDLPWTPLDLGQPVGAFTGRKLAALADDAPHCRALLDRAGIGYETLEARQAGEGCGYRDGIRLGGEGDPQAIVYNPAALTIACPVAAALAVWEWEVVQPAALDLFGQEVAAIEHYGGYSCRRINGSASGRWSEHATADAVDIAAFRLADGTAISIVADWAEPGAKAAFLHRVRDGGCDLFATVLSPDYNAAHADHVHFDQAQRGAFGWRGCR